MKVIIDGKNKTYKCTCNKCDSDLEYRKNDTYTTTKEGYFTSIENKGSILNNQKSRMVKKIYDKIVVCIKCPICENEIIVSTNTTSNPMTIKRIEVISDWER